jgi:hypothetical protein
VLALCRRSDSPLYKERIYPEILAQVSVPVQEKFIFQVMLALFIGVSKLTVGLMVSIRLMVAVVAQVFPARSEKVKTKEPLPVKRCPVALSPVSDSENQVSTTRTGFLVRAPVEGEIVAVGLVVSIQLTVAVVAQVLPARSEKVKTKEPLPVKRCHVALSPVRDSENQVSITRTGFLVRAPVEGEIVAVGLVVSIYVMISIA